MQKDGHIGVVTRTNLPINKNKQSNSQTSVNFDKSRNFNEMGDNKNQFPTKEFESQNIRYQQHHSALIPFESQKDFQSQPQLSNYFEAVNILGKQHQMSQYRETNSTNKLTSNQVKTKNLYQTPEPLKSKHSQINFLEKKLSDRKSPGNPSQFYENQVGANYQQRPAFYDSSYG